MPNAFAGEMKDLVTKDLILGNAVVDWVQAAIIFGVIFVVLSFLKVFFSAKYKKLRAAASDRLTYKMIIYSFIKKIHVIVIFMVALYPAIQDLALPKHVDKISKYLFIFAVFYQFLIWANSGVNLYAEAYVRKNMQKDPTSLTAIHIFTLIWKVSAFAILILLMLDQMGFNITTLLAGLGVGGIAVAFALQNILSDIFGSLAIIFDKPFKVGDMIKFNNFVGRVEQVGLKTTRLRNIEGELIVYSNNEILKTPIQNYGDIQDRRVYMCLGITYETPYEKMKILPELIRKCIFSESGTRVDSITCKQFADSSINFEAIYFVSQTHVADWLKIQNNVNMELMRVFAEEGISFAYPTRTVYTKSF